MADAIVVQGVGKRYQRRDPNRPTTLKETVLRGPRRKRVQEEFWGLRDVSLSVASGRMVGLIGSNGAGKSTLLRLVGGVGQPTTGAITVHGRIGALLDLGAGFHPDLTGRENVFVSGVISGLTRSEVAARFDRIVAFAELEEFIDAPLRTYSTGMQMRLAFAVASHIEPDILLIDEVLAVGDIVFQRKCLQRIEEIKARGCTILLVSHDETAIRNLCDEVVWLREGRLMAHGPAAEVVEQYVWEMSQETRSRTPVARVAANGAPGPLRLNENRWGSLEVEITGVRLMDQSGRLAQEIDAGASLRVEIDYVAQHPIESPIFGVTISQEDGTVCFDGSTATDQTPATVRGRGAIVLVFDRLDLTAGVYFIDVGIYEQSWTYAFDYHWHVYPLTVTAPYRGKGLLFPPYRWELTQVGAFDLPAAERVIS